MKKVTVFFLMMVSIWVLSLASVDASVVQTLGNYDFENGLTSWTEVNASNPGQLIEVVYDSQYESNVVHLVDDSTSTYSKLIQEVDVNPYKTYRLNFNAKIVSGNPRVNIKELDSNGNVLKKTPVEGVVCTDWTVYRRLIGPADANPHIVFDSNTARISIELFPQDVPVVESKGEAYYDNIQFYEYKIPEVGNKTYNSTFEKDFTYWDIVGDTKPGQTIEISSSIFYEGSKSAHLVDTSTVEGSKIKQEFYINQNAKYQLDFYAKVVSGSPYITIKEYDVNGNVIASNITYANSSSWARYTKTIGSAESGADITFNTNTKRVALFVNAADTAGTGEVYFDNIEFDIIRQTKPFTQKSIFNNTYPNFFNFRASELSLLTRSEYSNYDDWIDFFGRYHGMVGKTLDDLTSDNYRFIKPFFDQYILEHPNKIVIDHYSGRKRNVEDIDHSKYFPGHWLYYEGTNNTTAIPAQSTNTIIDVQDASIFSTNIKNYQGVNDDIVIVPILANGSLDWINAEHVVLISKNEANNTIKVKRGQYGTTPKYFSSQNAYIAPHVINKITVNGYTSWGYNFSVDCPTDAQGKRAIDVFSDEIAALLGANGELQYFDGIEFDVLFSRLTFDNPEKIDTNGDGIGDGGYINGEERYGLGTHEFGTLLRTKVGNSKLIMADGSRVDNQRNFDTFNGMESEGFPHSTDLHAEYWSDGLNRHMFWDQNHYSPKFNYYINKYRIPDEEVPLNIVRLSLSAGPLTNYVNAISTWPIDSNTTDLHPYELSDEINKGTANQLNWLGQPVGNTVHLAKTTTDILNGDGVAVNSNFINKLSGTGLTFSNDNGRLKVSSNGSSMIFTLNNVSTSGPNLTIFSTLKANAENGRPAGEARLLNVRVKDTNGNLIKECMSWMNGQDFDASFFIKGLSTSTVNIEFEVEGTADIWLSNTTIHAAPDAVYREFEYGAILVNPSDSSYTFNLSSLFAGQTFHRIQGTSTQDTTINDGSALGNTVSIPKLDALFIIKD